MSDLHLKQRIEPIQAAVHKIGSDLVNEGKKMQHLEGRRG
jgi:hypothetical protein